MPEVTPEIAALLRHCQESSHFYQPFIRRGRQREVGEESVFFLDIFIYASSAAGLAFQSRNQSEESIPRGGGGGLGLDRMLGALSNLRQKRNFSKLCNLTQSTGWGEEGATKKRGFSDCAHSAQPRHYLVRMSATGKGKWGLVGLELHSVSASGG